MCWRSRVRVVGPVTESRLGRLLPCVETEALETDATFRQHLASGDVRRAAEWLVRNLADDVLGLCAAMVRDRSAAEDLAQDVFGRAFASLPEFRGEASIRTWLLTIARNRCIDHLRRARRDPWAGAPADDAGPDAQPDDAPLPPERLLHRDDIEAALDALSEGERALVILRYRHGLEYEELASAFGLKEGTVRMRISRALGRMREALLAREPEAAIGGLLESAAPRRAPMPPQASGMTAPRVGATPPIPRAAAAAPTPSQSQAQSFGANRAAPPPRPGAPAAPPAMRPAPSAPSSAPPSMPAAPARVLPTPPWMYQLATALKQTATDTAVSLRDRLLAAASSL